jgi:oxazoline/thiazoline dehydrogenase
VLFHPRSKLIHRLTSGVNAQGAGCLVTLSKPDVGQMELQTEAPAITDAILALVGPGRDWPGLTSIAARGGAELIPALAAHMTTLRQRGALEHALVVEGVEHVRFRSPMPSFRFSDQPLHLASELVLSRFAYARREDGALFVDSPEALCRLELVSPHSWGWLGRLAQAVSLGALLQRGQHCFADFVQLLWRAGFLEEGEVIESPSRATWEFQDLLFHWSTRGGRVNSVQGGTFRFLGKLDAPRAMKERMSSHKVDLSVPNETERSSDLVSIIEQRRSIREQGQQPIRAAEIARLLYHTARAKERVDGDHQELLLRPVPAAGAIHEIEVYLAVYRCEGLDPGLYHYHAEDHALFRLDADEEHVTSLLAEAAATWGKPDEPPQVLVVLASRVPRIAWKYEGIAYRLSLLNAGAIVQSLYLLATEMGLACTALGGGDSMVFAAATGLDPLEETSIAEFALGSRSETPSH